MEKEFKPNKTPREIFLEGSFGGVYWHDYYSNVLKKKCVGLYKKYPASWWKDIPDELMISQYKNENRNKYKVKVGSSLREWEKKGWIIEQDPYGWVQWYCEYYNGRRSPDDERQIKRWLGVAGPNGRFRKRLINIIKESDNPEGWDNYNISPKIRQTLLHWGYELTKKDFYAN